MGHETEFYCKLLRSVKAQQNTCVLYLDFNYFFDARQALSTVFQLCARLITLS
jgi:hypothetical protein